MRHPQAVLVELAALLDGGRVVGVESFRIAARTKNSRLVLEWNGAKMTPKEITIVRAEARKLTHRKEILGKNRMIT